MLTKSKSHWALYRFSTSRAFSRLCSSNDFLYSVCSGCKRKSVIVNFFGRVSDSVGLEGVQEHFDAVKTHTGKEVELLGDAKDKAKKEQKENDKEN